MERNQKLQEIYDGLKASDNETRLAAARQCREMVCAGERDVVDRILRTDILPKAVACLRETETPELLFECLWTLTNIASGTYEHTSAVVNAGAVPLVVSLVRSGGEPRIREQALWLVGNIIGDGSEQRDRCIRSGIVTALVHQLLWRSEELPVLRQVALVIKNLFRHNRQPVTHTVARQLLPVVKKLMTSTDHEVLGGTTWALVNLTDGPHVQLVVDADIVPKLVLNLDHVTENIQTASFRSILNISAGTDDQTQAVLDSGALAYIPGFLKHAKDDVRIEALWFLSNVMAGPQTQKQEGLDSGLLHETVTVLESDFHELKIEAALVISNAIHGGTMGQVCSIVDAGVVRILCDMLLTKVCSN